MFRSLLGKQVRKNKTNYMLKCNHVDYFKYILTHQPYGSEIDFVRNPISGSAAWFFVIIREFIFTAIFEIKIHFRSLFMNRVSLLVRCLEVCSIRVGSNHPRDNLLIFQKQSDLNVKPYFSISCMIFRYYPEILFYTHFGNHNTRKKKFLDTKNSKNWI